MKRTPKSALLAALLLSAVAASADTKVTFQVDMTEQINGSIFSPGIDTVSAQGTFDGWGAGVDLTNNPTAANPNLYGGTADDTTDANGTVLLYKYVIDGSQYENTTDGQNRCAQLPTGGGSLLLPAAFYGDAGPTITANVTFQVDMAEQINLGVFNTNAGSTVEVHGTFNGWGSAGTLTNDPTILTTNATGIVTSDVYVGVIAITGPTNGTAEFKYVMQTNGIWENPSSNDSDRDYTNNRFFAITTQTLPIVSFGDEPLAVTVTNNVTFEIDMTTQIKAGNFPAGDTVEIHGDFNNWGSGQTMTNNPAGGASNIYSTVIRYVDGAGAERYFKYAIQPGTVWENVSAANSSEGNRHLNLLHANGSFTNGPVYFSDEPPTAQVTWINPAPITYGAALTSNQLDATASVGGTFDYLPSFGAVLDTGTNWLTVYFYPGNTSLYNSVTDTVPLVVLPAPLSVAADNATRPYGQANPAFTGTMTGLTNGDNITATYNCGATISSPAGTYPIVPSLADPNNRLFNYIVTISNGVLNVTGLTNVWSNTGGGNWSNPANWLSYKVPGPYDIVFITNGGVYTVLLDTNAIVGSLTLGGGSGSQTLLVSSNNTLNIALSGMTVSSNAALVNVGNVVLAANVTGGGSLGNYGNLAIQSGTINILGNMSLGASSFLTLPVNSTNNFGQITAGGFFQMGGRFNLNFDSGFVPGPSQSFRLLNWGAHAGGFSSAGGLTLGNGFYLQGGADYSGLTFWVESSNGYPALPPTNLVNQTVAVGEPATFFIAPLGTPPFVFQWQQNGTPVFSETNTASTLTIPSATSASAGAYCVVVVDATPLTNIDCATLTVLNPPAIVTQPIAVALTNGGSASLSAAVTGDGPLKYEWWLNGQLLNGATNSKYAIASALPQLGGTYTEAIYNAVGAVTTSPVVVTYSGVPLPFSDGFANRGAIFGLSGVGVGSNFNATRETGEPYHGGKFGDHSVWLQWTPTRTGLATINTRGSSFDTLLGVYTGTNVASLTTVAGDDDSGGYLTSQAQFYALAGSNYAIAVDGRGSNGAGNIVLSWSLATNTVPTPVITQHPVNTAASLNGSASLNVAAASAASPSNLLYQWYNGGWLAVPGATSATLSFTNVTAANVGFYSVEVTDANGLVADSAQAALEIGPVGFHSFQKSQDLFDALAGLPSNLRKLDGGFQSVSIGTLGQLTVNNGNGRNSQDSCYDICNNAIYLGLTPTANGTFIVNDSCSSSCSTFQDVVLDIYQYVSGNYNPVACATYNASLGFAQVTFAGTAGDDYVVEIDGANNMSGTVQVNYQFGVAPVSGISSPASLTQKELSSFQLTADISNGALSLPAYQWYRNGGLINGATGTNYSDSSVQFADAGTYSVVAANVFGSTGAVPVAYVSVPGYLPAPALSAPANAGTSTPVPAFSWSQVSGATGYQLIVATVSGDLPTAPESISGGPTVVVNTNIAGNPPGPGDTVRLDANTNYYWEVQASNSTQWGTWSGIFNFSTPVGRPDFTNLSLTGGALNLTVAGLTPQAIVVISNSRDLRQWSFLTNSTNTGATLPLSLNTNLLPLPQFLSAFEH